MIRKRGTSYQVVVYAGRDPLTGRERQISCTAPTKAAAKEAEGDLLRKIRQGRHLTRTGTFRQLLDAWYEHHRDSWSPTTARSTRLFIDVKIPARLGDTPARRVTTADLDRYYRALAKHGGACTKKDRKDRCGRFCDHGRSLSAASVRRYHVMIHACLEQGMKWDWIDHNPADRVTLPRVPDPEVIPPTPAEVKALLAALDTDDELPFLVYLRLGAITGARRSQLCGFQWRDLDADTGRITSVHGVVDGGPGVGIVVKDTKTHTKHPIHLDPTTVDLLRRLRLRSEERALKAGVRLKPAAFVFSDEIDSSKPWRPDTTSDRFAKIRTAAGLPHVRLSALRHYVGTQLGDASFPLKTIQGRLAHRRASTTSDRYMKPVDASDDAAARHLEHLLADEA